MGMHNHQPFEHWLLSEEPLEPEQEQQLRQHLADCEACRQLKSGWIGVQHFFNETPPVSPASGFQVRWQMRLAEEQRRRHRRQSWAMLIGTSAAANVFLALVISQVISLITQPEFILMIVVYRITNLFAAADSAWEFIIPLIRTFITAIPLPVWIVLTGLLTLFGVLWFVAFQTLASVRRLHE